MEVRGYDTVLDVLLVGSLSTLSSENDSLLRKPCIGGKYQTLHDQRRCDRVSGVINQVSRGLSLHTRMPVHCCTPTLWLGTQYVQISIDLPLLKSHCTPRIQQQKGKN